MILSSFIVVFDILSNVTAFFILDFQCLLVDLERPNLEFDVFLGGNSVQRWIGMVPCTSTSR
jgi:hypothetical protein